MGWFGTCQSVASCGPMIHAGRCECAAGVGGQRDVGAADFLGGTATRRLPSYVVVDASEVLVLAVLVPVALVTGGLHASAGYLPWAVAAGLLGLLALSG